MAVLAEPVGAHTEAAKDTSGSDAARGHHICTYAGVHTTCLLLVSDSPVTMCWLHVRVCILLLVWEIYSRLMGFHFHLHLCTFLLGACMIKTDTK